MNERKTKAELLADNQALGAQNLALRRQIADLEFKLQVHTNSVPPHEYPLIDGLGRRFRLEGRVRCYPSGRHVHPS
jgi:hypothetical protein